MMPSYIWIVFSHEAIFLQNRKQPNNETSLFPPCINTSALNQQICHFMKLGSH